MPYTRRKDPSLPAAPLSEREAKEKGSKAGLRSNLGRGRYKSKLKRPSRTN